MLPSTRKISIIVAMITLPLCTFAISKKEAAKLEAISKEMYEQGNEKYLYVDFYKDGLLKDSEDYTMTLDSNSIVLNGKQLPEPYHTVYKLKRMQFYHDKEPMVSVGRSRAVGKLRVKDICNTESCFRKNIAPNATASVIHLFKKMALDTVIDEMVKDGAIADGSKFSFVWENNAISINGKELDGAVAARYLPKLEKIEGLRTGNRYGFTRNMN